MLAQARRASVFDELRKLEIKEQGEEAEEDGETKQQQASDELLADAGCRDLTAHLCIDTLLAHARDQGWTVLGQCRQGEALLALGLGERLHNLQRLPATELPQALQRREALLRLVDPAGLGEFRWIALSRFPDEPRESELISRCLEAPKGFS